MESTRLSPKCIKILTDYNVLLTIENSKQFVFFFSCKYVVKSFLKLGKNKHFKKQKTTEN